jgi:branched-chain amino acid transport system permease protein
VFGLLIGGLYGLGAVGLSLVFGVLAVLNVAHGELIMLGGYVSVWLFTLWGVDPFVSVLVAGPALFLVGAVLFKLLFRRMASFAEEDRIKSSILVGFGLALVMQTLAIIAWGADDRAVTPRYAGAVMTVGNLIVPLSRLGSLVLAFLVLGGVHLFLTRTRMGTALRASADDEQGAVLAGIPIGAAYLRAFALGSALAGVAGALVSVSDAVSPAIGLHWTLKALIVIVLGGMGNIFGTFVAGLFLGLAEAMSGFLLGNAYREVVGLMLFLLVLSLRPKGLLTRS